jgi:multicomponent Na+:H+ antiporter subunit D
VTLVFVVASVLTGAAILRAAARVFGGFGPREDPWIVGAAAPDEVDPELDFPHDRVPRTMTAPTLALAAGGLLVGLTPGLRDAAQRAAERFVDRSGYAQTVLHGHASPDVAASAASPGTLDLALGLVTVLGALALAWMAVSPPRPGVHRVGLAAGAGLARLRALHTGYVADYVTWLVVGAALLGALFAATLTT